MSARARPAQLAVLLAVLLVGAVTLRGYGPLAASEPPSTTATPVPDLAAGLPTPAPTTVAPDAAATTPDSRAAAAGTTPPATPTAPASDPLAQAVTEPNRPAFERSIVTLINLERTPDAPVTPMANAAKAACAALDQSAPLSVALHATCAPTIAVAKLTRVVTKRCETPTNGCARTALRLSAAAKRYVRTQRAYARTIRANVPAGACRRALLPTHDALAGASGVARGLQQLARAALAGAPTDMADARKALATASTQAGADARPAVAVIEGFHAACRIARYPDIA
jgi:hypothetical protein